MRSVIVRQYYRKEDRDEGDRRRSMGSITIDAPRKLFDFVQDPTYKGLYVTYHDSDKPEKDLGDFNATFVAMGGQIVIRRKPKSKDIIAGYRYYDECGKFIGQIFM